MATWNELAGVSTTGKFTVEGWLFKKRDKDGDKTVQGKPGVMARLGGSGAMRWKRRYFVLPAGSNELSYYECDETYAKAVAGDPTATPKGTIELTRNSAFFMKECTKCGKVRWTLTSEDRGNLKLRASSEADYARWAAALRPFCQESTCEEAVRWSERPIKRDGDSYRRAPSTRKIPPHARPSTPRSPAERNPTRRPQFEAAPREEAARRR